MEYKHELEIIGIGAPLMYEITEPIGFDGLKFENEQEGRKFNRSINFGALDKIEFVNAVGKLATTPQVKNQFGDLTEFLDYGLEWLLYGLEVKGFEFEVYYHLSLDGVYFPKMQLDFSEKDCTDGVNYVNCKLIDAGIIMDYKRQNDETFNAFNDKDFKQRTITPIQTFNYLRRATPINTISKFKGNGTQAVAFNTERPNTLGIGISNTGALSNNSNVIEQYGINNTLSFLSPVFAQGQAFDNNGILFPIPNDSGSFQLLEAKNDLNNITFNITDVQVQTLATINNAPNITSPSLSTNVTSAIGKVRLLLLVGSIDLETEFFDVYTLYTKNYPNLASFNSIYENTPNNFTITIPFIERSKRVYLYWACNTNATFSNLLNPIASANTYAFVSNMNIEIKATEQAIDNVIKAFTWYDLLNQASKVVNGIPLNAPKFAVNGEHYKNAIWNRRMISQNTDSFFFKPKDVFNSVEEVCADVEINRDEIFIDTYDKFYTNNEIGVFQIIPSKDYTIPFNDRFSVKSTKFAYKKYEQERTTIGTSNAIHTETENALPNYLVDGVLERKFDFIRDGFLKQSTINLEIKQPTTSTENDNDIFIENMVELAPSSFGTFGARLAMQWNGTTLKILNRDSNGDSGEVVFNWTTIGVEVGGNFEITNGVNIGNYTISELTNSVITLTPIGFTPTFQGDAYIKVKYFYTNVAWQTRTNQGVLFPLNNTMNDVYYSLKRTLLRWGSYLKTCMDYSQTTITNSFFKSNGTFESRLVGESVNLIENAPIQYNSLNDAIVNARLPKLELVADFTDVVDYMNAYKLDRGFIRCYDMQGEVIKGYVQKSDYNPFTNEFNVTLELKKEPQIIIVTLVDGNLTINGTNYGLDNWWNIQNDFIKFYDKKSRPITNFIKYNLVNLNGIIYNNSIQLSNALQNA
jgi:hypothetical protein